MMDNRPRAWPKPIGDAEFVRRLIRAGQGLDLDRSDPIAVRPIFSDAMLRQFRIGPYA
jgi:hypothetical protein